MTEQDVDLVFKLSNVWMGIDGRCNRSNQRGYGDYGARGITLCEEWTGRPGQKKFVKWCIANGYVEGLVIDRKDGTKGYSPDNCRWITQKNNCRNKSNNRLLTFEGITKCVAAWGDDPRCVVPNLQFQQRIKCGWSIERALSTPLRKWNG